MLYPYKLCEKMATDGVSSRFSHVFVDQTQKPTIRHWKLLRLFVESPEGLTLKTLAERLDVTPRTVNRDLVTLQQAGVPLRELIGPHGLKSWILTEKTPGNASRFRA